MTITVPEPSSTMGTPSDTALPKKLRDDAIIEAVCLLQFQSKELPEVVIGRLSDEEKWKGYVQTRLPLADIPYPVRNGDPNLKNQPVFALRSGDGSRIVQFSESVISYHLVGAQHYCGWGKFSVEIGSAFETLFSKLDKPEVKRISFRYINAIVPQRHLISNVHDLNLQVHVNKVKLDCPINLNYMVSGNESVTTTRIAHTSFVQVAQGGMLPKETSAIVDVEVTTLDNFSAADLSTVMDWIKLAHLAEKDAFFKLIPPEILEKLKEN